MKTNKFLLGFMILSMTSCGSCYREYVREQDKADKKAEGEAKLLEAESSKKIQIEDAKGENESAKLKANTKIEIAKAEAQAEIERARGVAEANRIIGESLKGNEAYLHWLWITSLKDGKGERIYIPTEAGLPIMEAGK